MVPWAIWTVGVAAVNFTLFIAIRGRWGRVALFLALASLLGTALGNAMAGLIGFHLLLVGEFNLLGASIGAQAAMVVTLVVAEILAPTPRPRRRRDGTRPGR